MIESSPSASVSKSNCFVTHCARDQDRAMDQDRAREVQEEPFKMPGQTLPHSWVPLPQQGCFPSGYSLQALRANSRFRRPTIFGACSIHGPRSAKNLPTELTNEMRGASLRIGFPNAATYPHVRDRNGHVNAFEERRRSRACERAHPHPRPGPPMMWNNDLPRAETRPKGSTPIPHSTESECDNRDCAERLAKSRLPPIKNKRQRPFDETPVQPSMPSTSTWASKPRETGSRHNEWHTPPTREFLIDPSTAPCQRSKCQMMELRCSQSDGPCRCGQPQRPSRQRDPIVSKSHVDAIGLRKHFS
jgi:hypothetical protein